MTGAPAAPARPAWYARTGETWWRDWWAVLHPPYTAWHLSYVLIGAGLAGRVNGQRLAATLIAFGLAVGVAAHALDEWKGRPLGTSIPSAALVTASVVSLGGAVALGAMGVVRVGWNTLWFVAAGVALVVAYNLELWGGRLHSDLVFAAAWGAFPVLTGYFAQTGTVRLGPVLAAGFAFGLSHAQRALSTEARVLRRQTVSLEGRQVLSDGTSRSLQPASLLRPLERALTAMSWAVCALGIGLVVAGSGH